MSKLYIVSRDGKSINDFLSSTNMTKNDIYIVKTASDLANAVEGDRFIIIPPLPLAYQYAIRPILHEKKLKNVTKKFNSHIN